MSSNPRIEAVGPRDDATVQLMKELSDAKTWPERFKRDIDGGADVTDDIVQADKEIEALESRAREAMKRLGCDCPETRAIFKGMADTLINWHTFKDSL
jgi:hypothetical protein